MHSDYASTGIAQAKSERPQSAFDRAASTAEFARTVAERVARLANRFVGEVPTPLSEVRVAGRSTEVARYPVVRELEISNEATQDALNQIEAELARIERALP